MSTQTRRLTAIPTKPEAEQRLALWKASPGYVPGSATTVADIAGGFAIKADFLVLDAPPDTATMIAIPTSTPPTGGPTRVAARKKAKRATPTLSKVSRPMPKTAKRSPTSKPSARTAASAKPKPSRGTSSARSGKSKRSGTKAGTKSTGKAAKSAKPRNKR